MKILKLTDSGTQRVLKKHGLFPQHRLGRGWFAAVYGDGTDKVSKLTADSVQFEGLRDYLIGPHFPAMTENLGIVGEQQNGGLALYLFKLERLRLMRHADAATKRLAKLIRDRKNYHWDTTASDDKIPDFHTHRTAYRAAIARGISRRLSEDRVLPEAFRDAFQRVYMMSTNFENLSLDLHPGNFMVHPDGRLMLSDPIANSALM